MIFLAGTVSTDTFVIELCLVNNVAVDNPRFSHFRCCLIEKIENSSAFTTEKMYMWMGIAVVANVVVINGDHLCSIMS